MKQKDRPPLSHDPSHRIGVYKHLRDVPEKYRLYNYEAEYQNRDCWQEFMNYEYDRYGFDSEHYKKNSRTCERYWKEHMDDVGRHHCLPSPEDVETFFGSLLHRMNRTTAYNNYWSRLEAFFDYLMWHTDHPHVYHPPMMAAIRYDTTASIWQRKMEVNHV